ncbi:MAG: [FeFe] hydrogenase H-cluster maturation GTPase HydF [Alphaproteobacteria bacterium]|nr:[FeFe] hydrogenase H-cluster maturation GTPase HydF [Alphaproteobacteria bacterium]
MSALQTARAMRHIITLVGCQNAGKSSLINALCGEEVAIVSEVKGTTTDAVAKAYELLPLGPVTFYDTAGLDDASLLGQQRIKASERALVKADLALLVIGENGISAADKKIVTTIQNLKTPLIVVFNKCDIYTPSQEDKSFCQNLALPFVEVSASKSKNINDLKEQIVKTIPEESKQLTPIIGDLVMPKDIVVLVAPIDTSAPKGRLILPQVQVLREVLDLNASAFVCQPEELSDVLNQLKNKPRLVICDSQAVLPVAQTVPADIELTTFSILFARFKGDLNLMIEGAKAIDMLKDGSKVLIAEACAHHAQDDDIAKVKIPNLLKKYTKKNLEFYFNTGGTFDENLENYDLVVHCGGCMINQKEMCHRQSRCSEIKIPMTNYGIAISKAQGILDRVVAPFKI